MSGDEALFQGSRSNRLLIKKFRQFLLPTMITYAAVSLNEFADLESVVRLMIASVT